MNDILVRAIKTFVQAFLATMISEFYILLEMDAVHFFGQDMFVTLAPVICAALAAGFSAVGNSINAKLFPSRKIVTLEEANPIVELHLEDLKDNDFRMFIHRLSIAILEAFPEDAEELPSETITLNNNSAERDVESTSCAE